jgi:hypothetical protein
MTLQTQIRRSAGAANTQRKSLKPIEKGYEPRIYIILNNCIHLNIHCTLLDPHKLQF